MQFYLPDPIAQWPWPRMLNQHYQEAKSESDTWLHGFEALDAKSQRSFDNCDFREQVPPLSFIQHLTGSLALLSALGYPLLDKGSSTGV